MNVVIMQPFYLFLRKHFHQVQRADVYVFMDDTQFVKNGHHNRNRIKGPNGLLWLTVPVLHQFGQLIKEVKIDNKTNWRKKHWESIRQAYGKAPFFKEYADFFNEAYQKEWDKLVDINTYFIIHISRFLGITHTKFEYLSALGLDDYKDNPTKRLVYINEALGADNYIIGTRAQDYMVQEYWDQSKVNLEYFEPAYPPYPQMHGEFAEYCSIVDLLFNCGPSSGDYIWGEKFLEFNKALNAR